MRALFVGTLLPLSVAMGGVLKPDDYLNQVIDANSGIKGAIEASQGASLRVNEGETIYSTNLFATGQNVNDKRPNSMTAFQGDQTKYKSLEFGLSKATSFGLSGKVYYNLSDTNLMNTNSTYVATPSYSDGSLRFELNQPLWQNSFGRQFRKMVEVSSAQAQSSSYSKKYESQMLLFEAELRYWKLSAVRETIEILKTNLARTETQATFNKTKFERNLTDETDYLQSKAQLKARQLDLQTALDDEREAMHLFNSAREIDQETVTDDVVIPPVEEIISKLAIQKNLPGPRNDVRAAMEGTKALQAASEISRDKLLPDLSLFSQGSINGRDEKTTNAMSDSFGRDHPYLAFGVKLTFPLDFKMRKEIQAGYTKESAGAQRTLKKKELDQNTEWQNLCTKIERIRERLVLAKDLKDAQKTKLDQERIRQRNGKTTTFQVFSFELEYLSAQLNLVQMKSAAMMLLAQTKTFYNK